MRKRSLRNSDKYFILFGICTECTEIVPASELDGEAKNLCCGKPVLLRYRNLKSKPLSAQGMQDQINLMTRLVQEQRKRLPDA